MRQVRALFALLILGGMLLTAAAVARAEPAVAPHTDDGWSVSGDGTLRIESNAGWRNYVKNSYGLRPARLVVGSAVTELMLPEHIDQPEYYYPEERFIDPKRITVEAGNPAFTFQNGLLINNLTHTVAYAQRDITDAVIPEGVMYIGARAFQWSNIRSVRFPETLKRIRNNAFYGCGELTRLQFPDSLESIGELAFADCESVRDIVFSQSLLFIGASAFRNCMQITELELPDSLLAMDMYAFESCEGLTRVRLPTQISSIGYYAFDQCCNLSEVILPQTLRHTGRGAFCGCTSLRTVELPPGAEAVSSYTFDGCSALEMLIVRAEQPAFAAHALEQADALTHLIFFGLPPTEFDGPPVAGCTVYCTERYAKQWSPDGANTWRGYPLEILPEAELEALCIQLKQEAKGK